MVAITRLPATTDWREQEGRSRDSPARATRTPKVWS